MTSMMSCGGSVATDGSDAGAAADVAGSDGRVDTATIDTGSSGFDTTPFPDAGSDAVCLDEIGAADHEVLPWRRLRAGRDLRDRNGWVEGRADRVRARPARCATDRTCACLGACVCGDERCVEFSGRDGIGCDNGTR